MYRWGACGGELALAAQFSAHGAAQSLAPQRLGDASEIFHNEVNSESTQYCS
jgi:hypothetical protein